jgi:integrase
MYACGLRIGEAAKVAIGDIDNSKAVLRIIGKGNKERCVPLPMLTKLRRLWSTHRNPHWLTPDRSGSGAVGKNALWRTFRLAVRAAGIKRQVHPHGLRHSYLASFDECIDEPKNVGDFVMTSRPWPAPQTDFVLERKALSSVGPISWITGKAAHPIMRRLSTDHESGF